jgi:hypothetical protein
MSEICLHQSIATDQVKMGELLIGGEYRVFLVQFLPIRYLDLRNHTAGLAYFDPGPLALVATPACEDRPFRPVKLGQKQSS